MALTVYDYRVVMSYYVKTILCKNTFWYTAAVESDATILANAFSDEIMPAIFAILANDADALSLSVDNLGDPDDFYLGLPANHSGGRGTDVMKQYNGWYFRYNRATRSTANGRKTFGGVAEADVTDGEAVAGALVLLDALEVVLETPFMGSDSTTFSPMIAHTEPYTNPETDKTYRVPVGLFPILNVEYVGLSTQNSRKR